MNASIARCLHRDQHGRGKPVPHPNPTGTTVAPLGYCGALDPGLCMLSNRPLAVLLISGSFLLGSCGRANEMHGANNGEQADSPATSVGVEVSSEVEHAEPEELPNRIYYNLTQFDWYARGEPIHYENAAYRPRGAPIRASADRMEKAGEYQGVEFYRADEDGAASTVVYVPVFEGFWLPFVRDSSS
ncbi:MAG: hypothetical protein ACREMQ_07350 [Longimicrobiales bacterium]